VIVAANNPSGFCCTCEVNLLCRLRKVSRHSICLNTFIEFYNIFFYDIVRRLTNCFNVGRF